VDVVLFHDNASLYQGMGMALRLAVPLKGQGSDLLRREEHRVTCEGCVPAFTYVFGRQKFEVL
jgi:hypothetical protein